MAELRLHFLCVSALSRIRFLVCLEKVKAEHADLVYFNAVRLLSSGKLFKRFTELFPQIKDFSELIKRVPRDTYNMPEPYWLVKLFFPIDVL